MDATKRTRRRVIVIAGVAVVAFAANAIVFVAVQPGEPQVDRSGAPSASAIGAGAHEAGFFTGGDASSEDCVGRLFLKSSLSNEILRHVAAGDLSRQSDWTLGEPDAGILQANVSFKVEEECDVTLGDGQ